MAEHAVPDGHRRSQRANFGSHDDSSIRRLTPPKSYKVTDRKLGHVLSGVDFPLGYVHGHNEILTASVRKELEGKSAGDVIEGGGTGVPRADDER